MKTQPYIVNGRIVSARSYEEACKISPTRPAEQPIVDEKVFDQAHGLRERAGNGTALDWQREALNWQNKAMRAYAQRDELLAALKSANSKLGEYEGKGDRRQGEIIILAWETTRDAIAKCEASNP